MAPSCRRGAHVPKAHRLPTLQSVSRRQGDSQLDIPVQVAAPHSLAGSVPAAYGVQPPTSPGTLQASHVPSHAPSQQTPSTQWPEAHSAPAAHDRPFPLAPLQTAVPVQLPAEAHAPFTHSPEAQPAPEVQPPPSGSLPRQVPFTHVVPASQPPGAHPERHPPAPVQVEAPHSSTGSVPEAKGTHAPGAPGVLQASQGPVQEVPQQTPSVQWPVAQAASRSQASPSARTGRQDPPTQASPGLQAQSAPQGVAQPLPPLQVNVPQAASGSEPAGYGVQPPS